jgi:hypothetical protein
MGWRFDGGRLGFRFYRTHPWDKGSGIGNYIRDQYEYLLFGYRGKMAVKTRYLGNKIVGKRGPHSAKPIEAYQLINRISFGPVVELFARPHAHLAGCEPVGRSRGSILMEMISGKSGGRSGRNHHDRMDGSYFQHS